MRAAGILLVLGAISGVGHCSGEMEKRLIAACAKLKALPPELQDTEFMKATCDLAKPMATPLSRHSENLKEAFGDVVGPCHDPAAYGLEWRNTPTWCLNKIDPSWSPERQVNSASFPNGIDIKPEFGMKRVSAEGKITVSGTQIYNPDTSNQEVYVHWAAGVFKAKEGLGYGLHICGCKQSIWKAKRRGQEYQKASSAEIRAQAFHCPANATLMDGVMMGPDLMAPSFCPAAMPWPTTAVITGCQHGYYKHAWFKSKGWSANCNTAPQMVPFLG